jgi:hypothetical protein
LGSLTGQVIKKSELCEQDIDAMFSLMDTFYDNMKKENFLRDLSKKDFCIVLRDKQSVILGFPTQQVLHIPAENEIIHGVFSGDTIIHKQSWGSIELFKKFARLFFEYEKKYGEFYWFLISKGYKTYKMLPTFFRESPLKMKSIMDAFGEYMYKEEYNSESGVIYYKDVKDKLKEGVADITPELLNDKDIAFFAEKNPDYKKGNDIVCVAKMSRGNLIDRVEKLLF